MKIEAFDLERWMTTWELNVSHDITESGIAPLSISELLDLCSVDARQCLDELLGAPQRYSEARGTAELRGSIAATYRGVGPDEILVTTGAIEANYLVFNELLEPGDHVVVTTPCYQQLVSVPKAIGCEVAEWRVTPESGFTFDLDALESLVTPATKLIVVNSPHNPTGALLRQEDFERAAEIAARVSAWVLSDEAYRWIEHPGGETLPAPMRDIYPRAISIGTVSKFFGLPGLRLGWLAANRKLAESAWGRRDYTSLSPAWLSDRLARLAVDNRSSIQRRNDDIIGANLAKARTWFEENEEVVAWKEPRAGLLAMIDVIGVDNTDDLSERLAAEAGVMLAPGSAFDLPGFIRIGLGQEPPIFAEALDRTASFIRQYRNHS